MQSGENLLGQILVKMGHLDPDDLDMALREHHKTGGRIGEILLKMQLVSEEDLLKALAHQLGMQFVKISEIEISPEVVKRVPAKLVTHYQLLPIEQNNGALKVAVSDPLDMHTLDDLRMVLNMEIEPVVSTKKEIGEGIKRYYGIGADTMEELMDDAKTEVLDIETKEAENIEDMAEDASIVRFVNQIISEAFHDRATDIHVEPYEDELRIRYRIDGMLYEAQIPQAIKRFQSAIISRIKIMADMNIAERRMPQDGKIKVKMGDIDYDLRVSSVPTPYGESIAIRILSKDSELCKLDLLGFDDNHQKMLREMINKPHGIVLITGPTGSGKSTTLYAALSEINTFEKKIITIEDPIEYRIIGTTQIQVNAPIGLTFARILRNVLRHDPDVIMVGETRDPETAKITIQTALTGHLVFSTLHTNDAAGAITRLEDMGIEPFLIASSVEGILAQRLVRVLCKECKVSFRPKDGLIRQVNMTMEPPESIDFKRQVGCESCRYTGFRGRTAVYEIIKLNEELRRNIVSNASANVIKKIALEHGTKPLRYDGWLKVKSGITTIEEVLRVSMEDEFTEAIRKEQAEEAQLSQGQAAQ